MVINILVRVYLNKQIVYAKKHKIQIKNNNFTTNFKVVEINLSNRLEIYKELQLIIILLWINLE